MQGHGGPRGATGHGEAQKKPWNNTGGPRGATGGHGRQPKSPGTRRGGPRGATGGHGGPRGATGGHEGWHGYATRTPPWIRPHIDVWVRGVTGGHGGSRGRDLFVRVYVVPPPLPPCSRRRSLATRSQLTYRGLDNFIPKPGFRSASLEPPLAGGVGFRRAQGEINVGSVGPIGKELSHDIDEHLWWMY